MKAHSPTHQHDKKSIFQFLPGPVKIKDGLFFGDQIAARDIQFIMTNKVTHIINTVSGQIPNLWERFGIHYLSVNWTEKEQNIFDKKNNSVNKIFNFVQQAMQLGQSCLIHSVNGKSRACAVLVAYLMKKYAWSLNKCLQFTVSKKQNLEIRNSFLVQMQQLQQRMSQIYNLTSEWNSSSNQQQLVLRNTYANSKPLLIQKIEKENDKKIKKKVSWGQKQLVSKQNQDKQPANLNSKQRNKLSSQLRSILKGDLGPQILEKQNEDQIDQQQQFQTQKLADNRLINNINGNIVHVTVNNFLTSQKKSQIHGKNLVNARPYSSDQKDRQKQKKILNQRKILPYDTNALITMKSPYQNKLGVPLRAGSQNKSIKKQQKDTKYQILTYQRPQSAKNKSSGNHARFKDQLIVTNAFSNVYNNLNKKKYPTSSKEDFFRRK